MVYGVIYGLRALIEMLMIVRKFPSIMTDLVKCAVLFFSRWNRVRDIKNIYIHLGPFEVLSDILYMSALNVVVS